MVDFADALKGAVRTGFCSVIGTVAAADKIASRIGFGEAGSLVKWNMPDAIYQAVCSNDPPPPPPASFTGGQCDANYNVTVEFDFVYVPTGAVEDHSVQTIAVRGAVKGLRRSNPDPNTIRLDIVGGVAGNPSGESLNFVGSTTLPNNDIRNERITNVVRIDGNPDNCGDGPPQKPPFVPGSNIYNTNITYNNGHTDVTVPVGLAFGFLNVNANAELNVPVNATVNANVQLGVNFNLQTGDISFKFPSNDPSGNPYPDDRVYILPWDTTNSGPLPPKPPGGGDATPTKPSPPSTDKVIIGCWVTVTNVQNPALQVIYQTGDPNVYAPDLGLVSFNIPNSAGGGGWTPDQRVKNRQCYVPCPASQGAIAVKGTPRQGVTWIITPAYSAKQKPVSYPT